MFLLNVYCNEDCMLCFFLPENNVLFNCNTISMFYKGVLTAHRTIHCRTSVVNNTGLCIEYTLYMPDVRTL